MSVTEICLVFSALIAVLTLAWAVFQYSKNLALKRAEFFIGFRKRFKENELFRDIFEHLENNSEELANLEFKVKQEFLGFYEEIAVIMNSKLIKPHVVHLMFSYYAIRAFHSEHFFTGLNKESPYWSIFRDFVQQMEAIEDKFEYKRENYRI